MGGVRQQISWAKQGKAIQKEFIRLWGAPDAYRPTVDAPPSTAAFRPPKEVLHRLADYAKPHGATSGDAGLLANALMKEIDVARSYAAGFDAVVGRVARGDMLTVSGVPMGAYVGQEALSYILEAVATACRWEAYVEDVTTPGPDGIPQGALD